jgi:hypothetical protein
MLQPLITYVCGNISAKLVIDGVYKTTQHVNNQRNHDRKSKSATECEKISDRSGWTDHGTEKAGWVVKRNARRASCDSACQLAQVLRWKSVKHVDC